MTSNSLCDLGELGVSVVDFTNKPFTTEDAEVTEEAQRKTSIHFPGQTLKGLRLSIIAKGVATPSELRKISCGFFDPRVSKKPWAEIGERFQRYTISPTMLGQ
jgi:hypothetical protein